jgi:hypothetical protein
MRVQLLAILHCSRYELKSGAATATVYDVCLYHEERTVYLHAAFHSIRNSLHVALVILFMVKRLILSAAWLHHSLHANSHLGKQI